MRRMQLSIEALAPALSPSLSPSPSPEPSPSLALALALTLTLPLPLPLPLTPSRSSPPRSPPRRASSSTRRARACAPPKTARPPPRTARTARTARAAVAAAAAAARRRCRPRPRCSSVRRSSYSVACDHKPAPSRLFSSVLTPARTSRQERARRARSLHASNRRLVLDVTQARRFRVARHG